MSGLTLVSAQTWAGGGGFNPATLSLEGWWRPNYGGSPWSGTASAGGSGSRNLTEATNPPSAGTAINGLTPANFDGTNDKIDGAGWSTFVLNTAGSIIVLFNADTAALVSLGPFDNPGLVESNQGDGVCFSDSGFGHSFHDGTWHHNVVACATGGWHVGQCKWDASNSYVRVDSGSWTTLGHAGITDLSGTITRLGATYNLGAFYDGRIAEAMMSKTAFADAVFTSLVSQYFNPTYGLSL